MRIFITVLLCIGSLYIAFVLGISYDHYQFVWHKNAFIEALQRLIWILWPILACVLLALGIYGIPMFRHSNAFLSDEDKKVLKTLDDQIETLETAIKEINKDIK